MTRNYKKGKRLLDMRDYIDYNGDYIFLDNILLPVYGMKVCEETFELFDVYEAEEEA